MRLNYKTKELLSQETVNTQELEFAVEKTALSLSSSILATREALSGARARLDELKTTYPLDLKAIMDTLSEIEGYQKGLDRLKSLKAELGL